MQKADDKEVPVVGLRIGPQQASVHSSQGATVMHSAVSFSSPVQDEDMSLCESQVTKILIKKNQQNLIIKLENFVD